MSGIDSRRKARDAELRRRMENNVTRGLPVDGDVPWLRVPVREMRGLAGSALRDLLVEKSAFFDEVCRRWGELAPGAAARPGRFQDGKLFLYVESAGALFLLRGKVRGWQRLLSGLETAPKRFTVHLEIHGKGG